MTSKPFDEIKAKITQKVAEGKWDLDYVKLAVEDLLFERNAASASGGYRVSFDKGQNVDPTVRELACAKSENHDAHVWITRQVKLTSPPHVEITRFQCPGQWIEQEEPVDRLKVSSGPKERLQDAAQKVKERAKQTRRGADLGGAFGSVMDAMGDVMDALGDTLSDFFD